MWLATRRQFNSLDSAWQTAEGDHGVHLQDIGVPKIPAFGVRASERNAAYLLLGLYHHVSDLLLLLLCLSSLLGLGLCHLLLQTPNSLVSISVSLVHALSCTSY